MASIVDAAMRVKGDLSSLIDPTIVENACREAKHEWRDRTLDPTQTLETFATQIAHGNTALAHVVRLCGGGFSEAAYCKARQRLPLEVFRSVLRTTTDLLRPTGQDAIGTWKGHRTFMTDGSGCDMPDTPALQLHFGQPSQQKVGCGFPVANVLTLFDASSRMLIELVISPYSTSDLSKTPKLHEHLREGDILVGDRGFGSYAHLAVLMKRGAHGVFRANGRRNLPFPALPGPREPQGKFRHRSERPVLVELIGPDDQVVELAKPHNRSKWLTKEEFAAIPSKLEVRVLRYRVTQKGFRSREIVLMTSLLDARKYPAEEIAKLYLARWDVEINLRHLKQTMGMGTLHCKTVDGVTKELLMFALVYNAVCAVMGAAARSQGVPIDRVSFIDALRWLRLSCQQPDLPTLNVNPHRPGRLHPRCNKRGTRFPRLRVPRNKWREKFLASHP